MLLYPLREYLYHHSELYRQLGNFYYTRVSPWLYHLTHHHQTGKKVLFYPDRPAAGQVSYKLFHLLGYTIINDPNQKADVVVNHEDATFRTQDEALKKLIKTRFVINANCTDISKAKVDRIFHQVFGYDLDVDPLTYQGSYVRKSNTNSAHDGVILTKPQAPETGYVYQKVINNQVGEMVCDFRVPYIMGEIPLVYLKYRPVEHRFESANVEVKVAETDDVLSKSEQKNIRQLCELMGLDCGDLDVLRDVDDNKLYVVDVNNTPNGPPNHLSEEEGNKALDRIAATLSAQLKKRN